MQSTCSLLIFFFRNNEEKTIHEMNEVHTKIPEKVKKNSIYFFIR